jgi:hypothetical protein
MGLQMAGSIHRAESRCDGHGHRHKHRAYNYRKYENAE